MSVEFMALNCSAKQENCEVNFLTSYRVEGASFALAVSRVSDDRPVAALRAIHGNPAHRWTAVDLAAEAAMLRSAFFARFNRVVGMPPMDYLLTWRMAIARRLLRDREFAIEQIASQVGYGSASTFAAAFTRHVGTPPARYARMTVAE